MRPETTERSLQYDFTPDELADMSKRLANEIGAIESLEDDKETANKEFKEQIAFHATAAKGLAKQIRAGYEHRFLPCRVLWNSPLAGEKTIVRLDTGEQVAVEIMTEEERQEELPLASAPPAVEGELPLGPPNGNGTVIADPDDASPARQARRKRKPPLPPEAAADSPEVRP